MNWEAALPIVELFANTTLTVLGTTGIVPPGAGILAGALETAIVPLIQSIKNKNTTIVDIMAGYGAMVGVLNALKQDTTLPAATLTKIAEYLAAAQDASTAYLLASRGLDLSTLTPLTPIAVPVTPVLPVPGA